MATGDKKISETPPADPLSGSEEVPVVQGGANKYATATQFATFANAAGAAVPVNAQSGTSYTISAGDRSKLVTLSNSSAVAVTLPQAGGSFPSGWFFYVENRGAGAVTITPATSTLDGASSLILGTNEGCLI